MQYGRPETLGNIISSCFNPGLQYCTWMEFRLAGSVLLLYCRNEQKKGGSLCWPTYKAFAMMLHCRLSTVQEYYHRPYEGLRGSMLVRLDNQLARCKVAANANGSRHASSFFFSVDRNANLRSPDPRSDSRDFRNADNQHICTIHSTINHYTVLYSILPVQRARSSRQLPVFSQSGITTGL
jgi:hypothetical protein